MLKIYLDHPLAQTSISGNFKSEEWEANYFIPVGFEHQNGMPFADLLIFFNAKKMGLPSLDIGIDTSFHIAPPMESIIVDESFKFNDIKTLQYIFNNFADDIESIVDMSLDLLQEFHTNGYINHTSFKEFSIANLKGFREKFEIKIL